MDHLELLKKDWQKQDKVLPKLSYDTIYAMLHKRSASMVKWIFYISIGELLLWTFISFILPDSSKQVSIDMGLGLATQIGNVISYCVFAYFIYLFYRNYKTISVTENTKTLMEAILKTRRTVKYFVWLNIGLAVIVILAMNLYYATKKELLYEVMTSTFEAYAQLPKENFFLIYFLAQAIAGILVLGVLLLFYRIVYGILLKRLKKNYGALKQIDADATS